MERLGLCVIFAIINWQFTGASMLSFHINSVHGASEFRCDLCINVFPWASALNLHVILVHGAIVLCVLVSAWLCISQSRWQGLLIFVTTVFVCNECGMQFSWTSALI